MQYYSQTCLIALVVAAAVVAALAVVAAVSYFTSQGECVLLPPPLLLLLLLLSLCQRQELLQLPLQPPLTILLKKDLCKKKNAVFFSNLFSLLF